MSWFIKHRWFCVGFFAALLISLASVYLFNTGGAFSQWLHTVAAIVTIARVVLVIALLTFAYPFTSYLLENFTGSASYTEMVRRSRWKVLGWYLVVELIFALGHLK